MKGSNRNGIFFGFLEGNNAFSIPVALVSGNDELNVLITFLSEFLHPVLDSRERFSVCDVISEKCPVCVPIIDGGEGVESLLSGGIPDVEFDGLAVHRERL